MNRIAIHMDFMFLILFILSLKNQNETTPVFTGLENPGSFLACDDK